MAAILNLGKIFKKSLAHPHVARNVMLKILLPQENVTPDGILARQKSSFIRYQGDNASLGKPKNGEKIQSHAIFSYRI